MADQSTTSTGAGTGLQVSVEEPSSFARRLSVTVPADRVRRVRQRVTQQLVRNARIPGFRKGKLPEGMVQKQFGPAIDQQTVEEVIQQTYREALEQSGVTPIAQGSVEDVHYHGEGGELHYHVQVEVQPTVTIARTSGFVVARPSDQVDDAEVDGVIERMRGERATLHVVEDRRPDYGDEVQVRIEGEFDVTFPEDFQDAAQAGQTRHMTIGLVELRARELPALDDAFAQSVGAFDGMDALRARVRADLHDDARRRADAAVRDALIGQVLEANPLDAPPSMVERYLDYMTGQGEGQRRQKRTPEQEERFSQFREMLRPQAEASFKRMLAVETLADREGLRATQDEVDARVELMATAHGRSPSDVWLELEKSGQLQSLEAEITEDKVFDWLRAQNTVG
jgi:trigger factor